MSHAAAHLPPPAELEGWIVRKSRGYSFVLTPRGIVLCRVSNRLRKALVFPTAAASSTRRGVVGVRAIDLVDPVAVGDRVILADGGGGTGNIKQVLPRRNHFSRRIYRGRPLQQIVAANIDLALGIFAAARPDLRRDLLDRLAVQAEILGVPLGLIITKMDLADRDAIEELANLYRGLGYTVVLTCAPEGDGLDALKDLMRGKLTLLIGESGVGKSTLINAIQPDIARRVDDVRDDRRGRGRHTTTMVEALRLDALDAWIVDSPGINDLSLYIPAADRPDPAYYFRELRPLLDGCRFGDDCSHTHEPGCAILEALEADRIDPRRYESYVALRPELLTENVNPRG